ncbi:hypothetical protein [Hyphococcus sp.]|uniref:hypothetical protein n=1 Tax=Hyphococcus sp. TaxID=2038636 RepID=UPI003CCB7976
MKSIGNSLAGTFLIAAAALTSIACNSENEEGGETAEAPSMQQSERSAASNNTAATENETAAQDKKTVRIDYSGQLYELIVYPMCLVSSEENYVINAMTPLEDEPDTPDETTPSVSIRTDPTATKIEFWINKDAPQPAVNLLLENDERLSLIDGVVSYAGSAGDGSGKLISIKAKC